MAIQFQCGECGQKLSVPDNAGGKKTKCPKCSAVVSIPMRGNAPAAKKPAPSAPASPAPANPAPSDNPFADLTPAGGAPSGGAPAGGGNPFEGFSPSPAATPQQSNFAANTSNPYAAPAAAASMAGQAAGPLGPVGKVDAGAALSAAWAIFKVNAGLLIGAVIVVGVINFLGNIGVQVAVMVSAAVGGEDAIAIPIALGIIGFIGNIVLQVWINVGLVIIALNLAKGKPTTFGMMFSGGPYILPVFVSSLIVFLAVMIGYVLLIVPGVIVALSLWSFQYFIVDQNSGIMESVQLAWKYASGNRLQIFLMGLIFFGLMLLGALACGIGLIVVMPLGVLMMAVAYLQMTNQRIAVPQ